MRLLNKLYAHVMGYFWLPCPLCGKHFGGHEWQNDDSLPADNGLRTGICNACAAIRLARHNQGKCDDTCGYCQREATVSQLLESAGVKITVSPR